MPKVTQKYKAIVFDLDNTLLDFDSASEEALRWTLEHYQISGDFDRIYQEYSAINVHMWEQLERKEITTEKLRTERFRLLGEKFDWKLDNWEPFGAYYLQQLGQQTAMYSDTISTLEILKKDYPLGCLTNGISDVQRSRLHLSGLNPYFQAIIISSEYGISKPEPEIFHITCKALNVLPTEMLYIGDSVTSDLRGAGAAGIDFCWYQPGNSLSDITHGYQYKIRRLSEIPEILESI